MRFIKDVWSAFKLLFLIVGTICVVVGGVLGYGWFTWHATVWAKDIWIGFGLLVLLVLVCLGFAIFFTLVDHTDGHVRRTEYWKE